MKFSEYLRLNEGNYGHEFGKEAEKHEAAKEASREHAEAQRDESTIAPKKPHLQVGANSQEVANRTMSDDEQKKIGDESKDWRSKLRPTGDDGGAKAAREKAENEKDDKVQLDWQVPSLKEDHRADLAGDDEDDDEDDDDGEGYKWDGADNNSVNDSLKIPMRDALGRLSIYSMQEASTPKPLRKALKKAKMGKKLSNKESGNVMNNPKADGSTRTNAAENYKNPQDDIDANDAAEADRRENAVGMDRQSHLDK